MDIDELLASTSSAKGEDGTRAGPVASAHRPEGQIGTLLIKKSGKVKMRLGNDILLDVSTLGMRISFVTSLQKVEGLCLICPFLSAFSIQVSPGSQLDFLQHFVHIDIGTQKATPISEVKRRFVVTPDVDELLRLLAFDGPKEISAAAKKEEEVGLKQMNFSEDEDEDE